MRSVILGGAVTSSLLRLAATQGGDFNVLTMNVAGLPQILQGNDVPGDKKINSGTIGSYFNKYGYDVINVQEVRSLDLEANTELSSLLTATRILLIMREIP